MIDNKTLVENIDEDWQSDENRTSGNNIQEALKRGLVVESDVSKWFSDNDPRYEFTKKARKYL